MYQMYKSSEQVVLSRSDLLGASLKVKAVSLGDCWTHGSLPWIYLLTCVDRRPEAVPIQDMTAVTGTQAFINTLMSGCFGTTSMVTMDRGKQFQSHPLANTHRTFNLHTTT